MKYYLFNVNSIPSPQTTCVSYVLICNTEGDVMETILFALIFNSRNSIVSMRQYPQLHERLKYISLFVYDFWKFYDSIYLCATLV